MGRGIKSLETGVKKQIEEFTSMGSGPSGRNSQKEQQDACLFSFQTTMLLDVDEALGIKKTSPVAIIPHHTKAGKIGLFIQNKNMGEYQGPNARKILKCIKKNYIYEGTVLSLKKTTAGVEIQYQLVGKKGK